MLIATIIALSLLHDRVLCFQIVNLPRQTARSSARNELSTTQLSRASRSSLQSSIVEGDIETASVTLSGP